MPNFRKWPRQSNFYLRNEQQLVYEKPQNYLSNIKYLRRSCSFKGTEGNREQREQKGTEGTED